MLKSEQAAGSGFIVDDRFLARYYEADIAAIVVALLLPLDELDGAGASTMTIFVLVEVRPFWSVGMIKLL